MPAGQLSFHGLVGLRQFSLRFKNNVMSLSFYSADIVTAKLDFVLFAGNESNYKAFVVFFFSSTDT